MHLPNRYTPFSRSRQHGGYAEPPHFYTGGGGTFLYQERDCFFFRRQVRAVFPCIKNAGHYSASFFVAEFGRCFFVPRTQEEERGEGAGEAQKTCCDV